MRSGLRGLNANQRGFEGVVSLSLKKMIAVAVTNPLKNK
jgi:hypothetical protein